MRKLSELEPLPPIPPRPLPLPCSSDDCSLIPIVNPPPSYHNGIRRLNSKGFMETDGLPVVPRSVQCLCVL